MAYKYPNLAAEMARNDYDYKDLYELVSGEMGKTTETVSNWFTGRAGELPVKAAYVVKKELFPELTMEYLFEEQKEVN